MYSSATEGVASAEMNAVSNVSRMTESKGMKGFLVPISTPSQSGV
jgi:hypothetical protein